MHGYSQSGNAEGGMRSAFPPHGLRALCLGISASPVVASPVIHILNNLAQLLHHWVT